MIQYSDEAIALMRQIRIDSEKFREMSMIPYGAIPVGSECIRQAIKAEIRSVILRSLGTSSDLKFCEAHSPTSVQVGVSRFRVQSSLP